MVIKDWVNVYNLLIDIFSSLIKYIVVDVGVDSQSFSNGVLFGDFMLWMIQMQLKLMLSNIVSFFSYKMLVQIGIMIDFSDGKLELDVDKFIVVLKKDVSGVGVLIVGDGKKIGIMIIIGSNLISWFLIMGIIKVVIDGVSKILNKLIKDYNVVSDCIDVQVVCYKE